MSDNKRLAKRKWKNALLAVSLTASVILALPAWAVGPAQATEAGSQTPLISGEKCTLTIMRAGENPEEQGEITVDLYKVAAAKPETGYDAYTLELLDDYKSESISDGLTEAMEKKRDENGGWITDPGAAGINAAYRNLAQEAAKKALGVEKKTADDNTESLVVGSAQLACTATQDTDEKGEVTFSGLDQGMYLVVAHGTNMRPAQYIDFIDADVTDKEAPEYYGNAGQQIVTKAYHDGYTYTYLPELISVPMRGETAMAVGGSFSTSSTDPWQYNVRAELKSEQGVRMASLVISKDFTNTDGLPLLNGPTGSVFEIEARLGGEVVYTNVIKISTDDQLKEAELKDVIPVGAMVTVKEVYAGAGYEPIGNGEVNVPVSADSDGPVEVRVSFTNNYNGISTGGDIVTNSFGPGEDGWTWYQDDVEKEPGSLQTAGQ